MVSGAPERMEKEAIMTKANLEGVNVTLLCGVLARMRGKQINLAPAPTQAVIPQNSSRNYTQECVARKQKPRAGQDSQPAPAPPAASTPAQAPTTSQSAKLARWEEEGLPVRQLRVLGSLDTS